MDLESFVSGILLMMRTYIYTADGYAIFQGLMTAGLISAIVAIFLYVSACIGLSKIFTKIGENPWKAWIPFYNMITFIKAAGLSLWVLLVLLLPFALEGIVAVTAIASYKISQKLGLSYISALFATFAFPFWAVWAGFSKTVTTPK